jgi:hypothetical protein
MSQQDQWPLPDPLFMADGSPVTTPEAWFRRRRPELADLFQKYMYGYMPRPPRRVAATELCCDRRYLDGAATLREIRLKFGPRAAPPIHLLLVTPNARRRPAPVVLGLNFCGNHSLVTSPLVAVPRGYLPKWCDGCTTDAATEAGRGLRVDRFQIPYAVSRGYAVASFYHGDIDPDRPDFTDGIHPHYFAKGQRRPRKHDWGTIAAWAWGLSRAVDYLLTDRAIDGRRIAVTGHSRNGKASLLAGAFDERIAVVISHQSGCGGAAPSRDTGGEKLKQLNDTFPHWMNDVCPTFNEHPERLPIDQNCLVALCAPRPVLFTNATEDTWANPPGQFEVLRAADPVYRLLGVDGLGARTMPRVGRLLKSRLGYWIRKGKHSMGRSDWKAFLDFADQWMA